MQAVGQSVWAPAATGRACRALLAVPSRDTSRALICSLIHGFVHGHLLSSYQEPRWQWGLGSRRSPSGNTQREVLGGVPEEGRLTSL